MKLAVDRKVEEIERASTRIDQKEAHIAALNHLTDAVRQLTAALRSVSDELRREAYGQGRDDEADNLDYRYEPRSTS